MSKIIEPLKEGKTIAQYLQEDATIKNVGIVFFHGVGDCVMFCNVFDKLRVSFPAVHFDIMLQNGLGEELIYPDAMLLNGLDGLPDMPHDCIFLVHFPVETDPTMTKSELCCTLEIGIPAATGHKKLSDFRTPLIGVHFQNTALPDVLNCPQEIAAKIWLEIIDAGFVPIELDFQHVFHNPVNKKYDFIDCTVRSVKPRLPTLIGLMMACRGVVCAVSGPLHIALANMPDRLFYLERHVPLERFTYRPIPRANVLDYKDGVVKEWVSTLT